MSEPYNEKKPNISQKPTAEKVDRFYVGADTRALAEDNNYSTGDSNMAEQRRQAHAEAVQNEREHFDAIHPYGKPKPRWTPKEKK